MKNQPFLPVFFHKLGKKMMAEHAQILEKYSLSKKHVPFIMSLNDHKEGLYQSEIARNLSYNRAHISRTLKDLETMGFVQQETENTYKNRYFITTQGEFVAKEIKESGEKVREHIFSVLNEEEIEEFTRIVKKMTKAL